MSWLLAINLAVAGGTLAYQYFTREKPEKPTRPSIQDVELPRASQGVTIPFFFGQVRLRSPHVIWFGDFESISAGERGYVHQFSVDFCLGIPMSSDATPDVCLTRIWAENREIWEGEVDNWLDIFSTEPVVPDSDIQSGGGWLAFYPGWGRTAAAPHPQDVILIQNFDDDAAFDSTLLPAYRGFTRVVFREYWWGNDPSPAPLSFEVRITDDPLGLGSIADTDVTGAVDANPIEVIYVLLTHHYMVGLAASNIDTTSFTAAATTLASEGFGISGVSYDRKKGIDLIDDILRHIDGVLYRDHTDNKLYIKLVRDDYTVGALDLYDESVLTDDSEITFEKSTWEDLPNAVVVTYSDRAGLYDPRVAAVQDMAAMLRQGGRRHVLEVEYTWVTKRSLAKRLAQRELNVASRPLARVTITADRSAVMVRPGDVFKFSNAKYGITDLVLRVADIDFGRLDKDPVTIFCVEDQFAVDHDTTDPNEVPRPSVPGATPMTLEKVIESPRWLNAFRHSIVASGYPHLLYLGMQPAALVNDAFNAMVSTDDGVSYDLDLGNIAFSGYATLETALGFTDEYETTTTLRLENQNPTTLSLSTADSTGIRRNGGNLWLIDNPDGAEIVSHEGDSFSGGVDILTNLWRGLLDTVQRPHPVGTPCYQIHPGMLKVGLEHYGSTAVLKVKLLTKTLWSTLSEDEALPIDVSMVNRAVKPHPVDSPVMSDWAAATASNQPGDVKQDEQAVGFFRRKYDLSVIYRGDDADDEEADVVLDTQYDIDARIISDGTYTDPGVWGELVGNDVGLLASTTEQPVSLSDAIGHGDAEIRFVSKHKPLGGLTIENFQSAYFPFHAFRFRQLLPDASFELTPSARWTVVSGTPGEGDGAFGDGGSAIGGVSGSVVSSQNWSVSRIVDLSNYTNLKGLTAYLDWCAMIVGGGDDEFQCTIDALDASDVSQGTGVSGWVSPSSTPWNDYDIIYELPGDTFKIKILIESRAVGGGDVIASVLVDNMSLRVGQLDGADQQLLNPDWDNDVASWTSVSGTFAATATSPLTGVKCLTSTVDTAAELYQEVTVSAGYKHGATVFLEGWYVTNEGSDNTEVKIEAMTSGGTVLATATTGSVLPPTSWTRFELCLDLPTGTDTDKYRVTIKADGGTDLSWDRFRAFTTKELHPVSYFDDITFPDAIVQTFPSSAVEWEEFNGATCPTPSDIWLMDETSGTFASSTDNSVPSQHALTAAATVIYDQEFAGPYVGGSYVGKKCVEISRSGSNGLEFPALTDLSVDGTNSWALLVSSKFFGEAGSNVGMAGSHDGSTGWRVRWRNSVGGRLEFSTQGTSTKTLVLDTHDYGTGAPFYFVVKYNATTGKMAFWSQHQSATETDIATGDVSNASKVRIGGYGVNNSPDAQVSYAVLWKDAAAEVLVQADTNDWWKVGLDPSGELSDYAMGGELVAPISSDGSGIIAGGYAGSDIPIVYDAKLATGRGLSMHRAQTNLAPDADLLVNAGWTNIGGAFATETERYGVDAMRMKRSLFLSGSSSVWYTTATNIPAPGAGDYTVIFYAKAVGGSHNMLVRITDGSNTLVDSVSFLVGNTWAKYEITLDGSTLGASDLKVGFAASNTTTQDVELGGPVGIFKDTAGEGRMRYVVSSQGALTGAASISFDRTVDLQFNREGEVRVDGLFVESNPGAYTLAAIENGSTNQNKRELKTNSSGNLVLDHYDGSATLRAVTAGSTPDWEASEFTARGRWSMAGVMEDSVGGTIRTIMALAPDGDDNWNTSAWTESTTLNTFVSSKAFGGLLSRLRITSREMPL